ncbi:hypothetical protein [Priestia aryabhattai]|uniref:hypothetical protein n=1 Tax=Priestia aryabhattai TaxID=412384 RepID=UPI003D2DAB67
MTKQEMITGVQTKVEELLNAVDSIEDKVQEIVSVKNTQQKVAEELQAKIEIAKLDVYKASDLDTARELKTIVDALESDLKLQEAVNYGSTKAKEEELLQLIEDFFKNHAVAKTMYDDLDIELLLSASLKTIVDDYELMNSLAGQLYDAFKDVLRVMIRQGIAQLGTNGSYGSYKGTHLGQSSLSTRLYSVKSALQPEIRRLGYLGLL